MAVTTDPATSAQVAPRANRLTCGLALLSATGVLVAFTLLPWMRVLRPDILSDEGTVETTVAFPGIHRERDVAANAVVALDYVTWTGWTLLALTTVSALLAAVPGPGSTRWRRIGVVSGLVGAALTVLATARFYADTDPADIGMPFPAADGFGSASVGAWVALAGFVVGAGAAALGPGRRTATGPSGPHGRHTAAVVTAGLAGVLLLVGFAWVAWYDTTGRDLPEDFDFGSFGSYVAGDPSVIVQAYFPGLAYALGVLAVVAAAVGALRAPLSAALRGVAVVAGLAGATCTVWALADLLSGPHAPFDGLWDGAAAGPYLVVGGYLLAVVSAALPRGRDRTTAVLGAREPADAG